jgi:GTP-binding protein EngB required for normal cell division
MLKFFRFPPAKSAQGYVPTNVSEPVPARAPQSALLRGILGSEASLERACQQERKIACAPSSQNLNVGARLADSRREAVDAARKLAPLVDKETAETLRSIVEDLESSVCRIAIAGQMNAGKSSLINVLVEQAELLPADINPWTTVITRLHFAVRGKPASGASFRFFSHEEWRRLAAGGRTRELTERIFPDFNWDSLQEQLEIMRKQAERKLGPRLDALLGAEHSYATLTPGLLNRYVGAGHPEGAGATPASEGEFSDITKIADVFFDLGAFSYPAILIDTPGVNDPFLVRDEVTRQSLQAADICVVVVTARQPLSTADLSLLRLLRSLDKSRLIVFLNRVDEIDGSEDVLRAISHRVSVILKQEFPSARIPIVIGSALWARQALAANAPEGERGFPNGFDWPSQLQIASGISADALLLKSGVPALACAISELMQTGPVADAIEDSRKLIDALCWNLAACLQTQIQALSDAGGAKEKAGALISLRGELAAKFADLPQTLAAIRSRELDKLRSTLDATVGAFVAEQDKKITSAFASQFDTRLRIKLEIEFLNAFEKAAGSMAAALNGFVAEASSLIEASGLIDRLAIDAAGKAVLFEPPSLAALGEPATIETAAGLEECFFERLPENERLDYFAKAVAADFAPILARLESEAEARLSQIAETLDGQMRMLTLRPLEKTIARISTALFEVEISGTGDGLALALDDARETIARLKQIMRADFPKTLPRHG